MRAWKKTRRPRSERPMLVAVLSILAGVSLGGYGIHEVEADRQLIDGGTAAAGTVVSSREQFGRKRLGGQEIANVRFSAPGPYGQSPQSQDHMVLKGWPVAWEDAPPAEPGATVTVFYDPEDPSDAVVEGWHHRYRSWWSAGVLLFGGGGAIAAAKARSDAAVRRRARRIQASW